MAKKKKPKPSHPAPAPAAAAPATDEGFDIAEVWRHPTLMLAAIAVALALLSAWLAFQFRDDMTMGAIREPTGLILWSAIAATLFASYWRERGRQRAKPQS